MVIDLRRLAGNYRRTGTESQSDYETVQSFMAEPLDLLANWLAKKGYPDYYSVTPTNVEQAIEQARNLALTADNDKKLYREATHWLERIKRIPEGSPEN